MPSEKRKKTSTTAASVPELGDPDRKRVLNVLAQRRYRQKRREKVAALEAQAKAAKSTALPRQADEGGVRLKSSSAPSQSSSGSDKSSTELDAGIVEEVFRNPDDTEFRMLDFDQQPMDFPLFADFGIASIDFSTIPSPLLSPSTLSQPSHAQEQSSTSTSASSSQSPSKSPPQPPPSSLATHPTFPPFPITPDSSSLPLPLLPALRAFGTIATLLNVTAHIWNPFYTHLSPIHPHPSLPPNLHPTPAQLTIPHHPVLDILPWPSVREKLICILALPDPLRPPIARSNPSSFLSLSSIISPFSPTPSITEGGQSHGQAVMQMVQDLDDFESGVRVHGNVVGWAEGSELVEEAWEIGECFFRNWWFCLDGRVVEMANRRRRERGERTLRLEG
ncbi:hypothetical protein BCR34DRAFT_603534 [Clohesyomyces aquaticus]|uniref:BZIP domain-containing protein n=1 Tax=Clohesyomyces aquaticus TaxID=1231657 RepID=A0A1Y1ZDX4_9PLEO|nr:hypothetical protein BCR34DRAFT_603534 [Clohesyomyces aquaticus]